VGGRSRDAAWAPRGRWPNSAGLRMAAAHTTEPSVTYQCFSRSRGYLLISGSKVRVLVRPPNSEQTQGLIISKTVRQFCSLQNGLQNRPVSQSRRASRNDHLTQDQLYIDGAHFMRLPPAGSGAPLDVNDREECMAQRSYRMAMRRRIGRMEATATLGSLLAKQQRTGSTATIRRSPAAVLGMTGAAPA
jgi:hypothetical protein